MLFRSPQNPKTPKPQNPKTPLLECVAYNCHKSNTSLGKKTPLGDGGGSGLEEVVGLLVLVDQFNVARGFLLEALYRTALCVGNAGALVKDTSGSGNVVVGPLGAGRHDLEAWCAGSCA